jgi:hypothetical protein
MPITHHPECCATVRNKQVIYRGHAVRHSYTSLKEFQQCPRKYHEKRVLKLHPYVQGPEAAFGDYVHQALEAAGKHGTPLPPDLAPYQWVVDDVIKRMPGDVRYEHEFSLTKTGTAIPHNDWNRKFWLGKADVLALVGDTAIVLDFKTGKSKYPDTDQLELMALYTFMEFPQVNTVKGMLLFLNDAVTHATVHSRADFSKMYQKFFAITQEVAHAQDSGSWPEYKSPLCPWCPCTTCPNWRQKP